MEQVTGRPPVVLPLTMQDITPYGNGVFHVNSILQPATATSAPVVGLAITAETAVAGCGTGASHPADVELAARFAVEVAKAVTAGTLPLPRPGRVRAAGGAVRQHARAAGGGVASGSSSDLGLLARVRPCRSVLADSSAHGPCWVVLATLSALPDRARRAGSGLVRFRVFDLGRFRSSRCCGLSARVQSRASSVRSCRSREVVA